MGYCCQIVMLARLKDCINLLFLNTVRTGSWPTDCLASSLVYCNDWLPLQFMHFHSYKETRYSETWLHELHFWPALTLVFVFFLDPTTEKPGRGRQGDCTTRHNKPMTREQTMAEHVQRLVISRLFIFSYLYDLPATLPRCRGNYYGQGWKKSQWNK